MATKDPATLIEIMKSGMAQSFWATLVEITQENIDMLETEIITKTDIQTGRELTDAEVDRRRDKREAMQDLITLPEQIIKEHTREDVEEVSDDPYPVTIEDVARMDKPDNA